MTVGVGDICLCGDVALPGHVLCAGCLADIQAERAQRDDETARLTAEHEARVAEQDGVAA